MPNTIEFSGKTFTLVSKLPVYLTMKVTEAATDVEKHPERLPQHLKLLMKYILSIVVPEEREALDEHLLEHDFDSFEDLNEKIGTAMQLIAGDPKATGETSGSSSSSSTDTKSRLQVVSFALGTESKAADQTG